jgi:lauroyl/myristoyl acyltransferase
MVFKDAKMEEYRFSMVSAIGQKSKSNDLTNSSVMKPTETFPDNNIVFRLSHFIQRYRLNRHLTRIPFFGFQMISTLLHKKFSWDAHDQLIKTWKCLYPPNYLSKMNLKRWTDEFIKYNIELYLDATFYLSLRSPTTTDYFNPIIGLEHIERALQKCKGAFYTSNHFGSYNHGYFSLIHQQIQINGKPQKIKMVVIVSSENQFLFREIFRDFPNLSLILTSSFRELKVTIEKYLAKNYLILVGQDYYHPAQYRVPFNFGKERHNFLVPSPQMVSYFHLKQGIPIVPVISLPGQNLKRSTVKFLPEISLHTCKIDDYPEKLQTDLINYRNGDLPYTKHFGLLSTIINKTLNPHILTRPYLWQEAFVFFERTQFRIALKKITHLGALFRISAERLLKFMEKSYEPGRADEKIVPLLEQWLESATVCEKEGKTVGACLIISKYIEIGRLTSAVTFQKIIHILQSQQSSPFRHQYPEFDKLFDQVLKALV